eukprot:1149061-Prymnesium_polylepis.1
MATAGSTSQVRLLDSSAGELLPPRRSATRERLLLAETTSDLLAATGGTDEIVAARGGGWYSKPQPPVPSSPNAAHHHRPRRQTAEAVPKSQRQRGGPSRGLVSTGTYVTGSDSRSKALTWCSSPMGAPLLLPKRSHPL